MKMKCYRNLETKEITFEKDAEMVALDELGVTIKPMGEHGELTQDQLTIIDMIKEYYFDDCVKEDLEEEELEKYVY